MVRLKVIGGYKMSPDSPHLDAPTEEELSAEQVAVLHNNSELNSLRKRVVLLEDEAERSRDSIIKLEKKLFDIEKELAK